MLAMTPVLTNARVLAVDVKNRRLTVDLPSRQVVVVRMLIHGPADGVRVTHPAMPGRFTEGLVVFPAGDNRNGIWLGSIYSSQMDALTTDTDEFLEYSSHWSGAYEMLDGQGRWTKSFPDGTYIQVSDGTAKPPTYRHTVDAQQNQQLTPFTDQQRVPSPPSARHIFIKHASGTTQHTDPQGNLTVTGAEGATCTLAFGGATVIIDKDGNISASAASGQQVILNANGGSVQIDQHGAINVNAAGGQHLNVSAGGGGVQYTLVRTDLLVAAFNNHIHTNGNNGADTGTPVTKLGAGDVQSTMAIMSE
jgi:hypothetical protein